MKLSELSDALSDMRNYWIVQDNVFNSQSSRFTYRADKDRRFRNFLKIPRRDMKSYRGIFFMEAMSIVSSLSSEHMDIASQSELSEMIALLGYDPQELNKKFFPCVDTEFMTIGLPSEKLTPSVFLLTVAMSEAMCECSVSSKNWANLPSMEKLRQLVLYMQDNDILFIDYDDESQYSSQKYEVESYEDYVILQSEFFLQHLCLQKEAEKTGEQTDEKIQKWDQSFEKTLKRAFEDMSSQFYAQGDLFLRSPFHCSGGIDFCHKRG